MSKKNNQGILTVRCSSSRFPRHTRFTHALYSYNSPSSLVDVCTPSVVVGGVVVEVGRRPNSKVGLGFGDLGKLILTVP